MKMIISNSSSVPIYEQIKKSIINQILEGKLNEDELLPSIRVLAQDIKISAMTIKKAYDELEKEGYLKSIQGKGTFVAPKNTELAKEQAQKDIEKYIEKPRHIEFQILADKYGNTIHLGERDCSIQRNHQKLVEESPSPALNDELRKRMGDTAVAVAKAVNYENAGTVEFLLDKNDNYYFMEVNTRIQVEHGITELVTGVDLIKEQIKIAAGESLGIKQEDVRIHGAAMEIRINAENPEKNFAPNPGTIKNIHIPGGNGVRIDTAVYSGYTIPPFYDSMIMKVMTYANDRKTVIEKMRSVLGEIIIEGVTTNTDFMYDICQNEKFIKGDVSTDFIPEEYPQVCKK